MPRDVLISLIIPVYNVADYLEACLDSVLSQTYHHLEILLVDDGSTDHSGRICKSYAEKDYRVNVFHKSNGGLSDARNFGIEHANGDYLVFIDSDDVVSENYVEYLYSLVAVGQQDIGICDLLHYYGEEDIPFRSEEQRQFLTVEQAISTMLYQQSFLVAACGKIFKRSLFQAIRFPRGLLFEDSAIMYRVFDQSSGVVYGDAKLYAYRHRQDSITTSSFSRRDADIMAICQEIVDYFKPRQLTLRRSADAYQVVGALRIYLTAPNTEDYRDLKRQAKIIIHQKGWGVLRDSGARLKTRLALVLFFMARPLLPYIHKRVDRWK